ncbi:hypothetical protein [Chryseobacterium cucumeris]|uniref:hypothetical protein n=1 Tax=Chryseobacterium cucumeris TaxID=1813611 RepID=UPI0037BFFD5B
MIDINNLNNDIKHTSEHLQLMNKILTSYDIVHGVLHKNKIELAKDFEIEFVNFQYILVLSQFELSLVFKSIYYSLNDLEKIHNIKRGLLILYETKIALDKLNLTLRRISLDFPQLEDEFKLIIDLIRDSKKIILSHDRIEDIRNNVSAHINPIFLEYYKYFEKVDLSEDLNLLMNMKKTFYTIENFISKVRSLKRQT